MFSRFNNKRHKLLPVPEWAKFFTSEEYTKFLKTTESYFSKKGIEFELGDGWLNVKSNEFGFNQLGLSNVTQICKQERLSNYKKIVWDHFESLIKTHEFDTEFNKIISDFAKIRQYIGIRLYNEDYLDHVGKELTLSKHMMGDIYAMLVFDLPHSVTSIQPEQLDNWEKTEDELFQIGIENIKSNYPFSISSEDFGEFKIWFIQGDHFYAPNIVMDLNNYPNLIGSRGSLIGIPHRHAVIIYPIESLEIVNAINRLIPVVKGMNVEGPGSISNKMFWYNNEEFTELPYELDNDRLKLIPPENFVDMLNTLEENKR